jgi:hypothetical protein
VSGHGTKQNRKLEEAAVAMLTQRNVEEAARSIGISTATLMRWQKLPEFQTAYREARRAAYGQASGVNYFSRRVASRENVTEFVDVVGEAAWSATTGDSPSGLVFWGCEK